MQLAETRPELVERLVFITGDTMSNEASGFLATAGRPVLGKPFDLDNLRDFLAKTLQELD